MVDDHDLRYHSLCSCFSCLGSILPCLLSAFLNIPLELYYDVPLHTVGFFVTMATCYTAKRMDEWRRQQRKGTAAAAAAASRFLRSKWHCNAAAILACGALHVAFYETAAKDCLLYISAEYHFRFQADKYSAVAGIVSAFFWNDFTAALNWCHNGSHAADNHDDDRDEE